MNKRQLIDDIRRHNPTARARFLAQFDEHALMRYFERLQGVARKHVRISGWVRRREKLDEPSPHRLAS